MNYPLAAITDQFLTERRFLKDVSPKTLRWYRIAFKNYEQSFLPDAPPTLPTKASLQRFVITHRERVARKWTYCTPYPDEAFVIQCLRQITGESGLLREGRILLCDRDPKWSGGVEQWLATAGVRVVRTPPRAPNCNATPSGSSAQ